MDRKWLVSACLICVAGLALGSMALHREAAALAYGTQNSARLYSHIEEGTARTGLSYYSHKRLMAGCITGMTSLNAMVRTAEQNEIFARQCDTLSADILSSSPLDSFAWLISAQAAAVLKDTERMNLGLANSWATARNEQWLSTFRVEVAEANYAALTPEVRDNHSKDLTVLVESYAGISSIAQRYWAEPGFRERITDVVTGLPNDIQGRFLHYVREAAKRN